VSPELLRVKNVAGHVWMVFEGRSRQEGHARNGKPRISNKEPSNSSTALADRRVMGTFGLNSHLQAKHPGSQPCGNAYRCERKYNICQQCED